MVCCLENIEGEEIGCLEIWKGRGGDSKARSSFLGGELPTPDWSQEPQADQRQGAGPKAKHGGAVKAASGGRFLGKRTLRNKLYF